MIYDYETSDLVSGMSPNDFLVLSKKICRVTASPTMGSNIRR